MGTSSSIANGNKLTEMGILRKILSIFRSNKRETGYVAGRHTVIKGTVYKTDQRGQVSIGDYCLIHGTLTTYTKDAKIEIGDKVFIGSGTLVGSAGNIRIGNNVLISIDCLIMDSDTHSMNAKDRENDVVDWMKGQKNWSGIMHEEVVIDSNAWIGARSIILKGVHIGANAIVGAGSVVTGDVEPNTVVGGNPARLIKRID